MSSEIRVQSQNLENGRVSIDFVTISKIQLRELVGERILDLGAWAWVWIITCPGLSLTCSYL